MKIIWTIIVFLTKCLRFIEMVAFFFFEMPVKFAMACTTWPQLSSVHHPSTISETALLYIEKRKCRGMCFVIFCSAIFQTCLELGTLTPNILVAVVSHTK